MDAGCARMVRDSIEALCGLDIVMANAVSEKSVRRFQWRQTVELTMKERDGQDSRTLETCTL